MKTTVVALVSSNYLLRFGLQKLVESEKWIQFIDRAPTNMDIDDTLAREQPHIIIVDIDIESDIAALIRRIRATAPHTKIVLLSGFDNAECARQAIGVGVDGIVLKVQPSAVLIATIAHLASHSAAVAPSIRGESTRVNVHKISDLPVPVMGRH